MCIRDSVSQALDAAEAMVASEVAPPSASAAHQELVSALIDGRFEDAIGILNAQDGEGGQVGSVTAFAQLEDDLQELINQTRENTRVYINASLDATRLVSGAVAALTAFAVLCIWIGIRRRLGEYM